MALRYAPKEHFQALHKATPDLAGCLDLRKGTYVY